MTATTKIDVTDYDVKVPKGTVGVIVGVQWGDKTDGYIIDFPHASRVYVARENVITEVINVLQKSCSQEEEGKGGKSKRKKELPPPTVGKGSISN